ncbi:adenylate cyclase [Mycobacterium tuberculosis]|nr:adenylate cyclase [Mycobacterium tuberculosis]
MSKTREQRLRRVLETMTRQHDRLRDPPAYGSWLLGWVSERPLRRRVRIQIILTIALITANLVGIGLAVLLENVAFPTPSIVSDAPLWITFVAGPAYTVIGMALGSYYVKVQTLAALRWASEEHTPSRADQRNTLLAPLRVAVGTLILWAVGAALFTTLYGLANRLFIPQVMFSTLFCGVLVATACYMLTEFALRPVAAQALEAGLPPGRFALGIIGRTMVVWLLSSGVPLFGIALLGILEMVLQNFTDIQFAYGVLIVSSATHPCGSRSWPDPLIRSSGWRWAATTSRCRPWPRYGGRARNTRQVGPTNATPCWPRCGWRSGPSSCGQSERRCLPPSTGWLTAYSSRRSCSRHCFAAFWSPPPATCSPSSRCDP